MVQLLIDKNQVKAGEWLLHRHLGMVKFTSECQRLEQTHGTPTTMYVAYSGEIKEVTLALLEQSAQ
jgi:hypothetical protein